MSDQAMNRMEPPADPDLQELWAGTRDKQLLLPWCRSCEKAFWYPRPICPHCLGDEIDWRPTPGRGVVHAVSVMHRPANPLMADKVPYAVVLVDLDEEVRLMSNMVNIDATSVEIGQRVQVTWEPLSDGRHIWLFEPGG
ncbi:MAG TPA: OB-fold domain-containing protein [Acidimicrobiales bacterium]|nr:OB-fold domain-containing protein [Acidimicrobiales bacterium]